MGKVLASLVITLFCINLQVSETLAQDSIPQHDTLTIYSKHTKENLMINIWLPRIYKLAPDSIHLPVLYMPDGGVREDFPHIANTLGELIENGEIPPHILVGIENTERGRDLTGSSTRKKHKKYGIPMTDGAKDFRAFITDELMPEIDQRYRTTKKKGIIGESLAGLFVMETLFLSPKTFDFYIAFDPSLWWNKNYLVENSERFLEDFPDRKTKLWFAGSSAKDISKYTRQLSGILDNSTLKSLIWEYSDEPKEKHHTIFRSTKIKALIWSLND